MNQLSDSTSSGALFIRTDATSKVRERRIAHGLIGIIVTIILLGGFLTTLTARWQEGPIASKTADTAGYFSWGYAVLNEGTLDPGPTLQRWSPNEFPPREVNGRAVNLNKFPIGWSLSTFPFMAVGKWVAMLRGWSSADPRTLDAMIRAAHYGVLFWAAIGMLCAYGALSMLTNPLASAISTFFIWLGTSAFAYTWRGTSMSHGVSLAFVCITFFAAARSLKSDFPARWAFLCGLSLGMVVCCRIVNIMLVLPALGLLCMRVETFSSEPFVQSLKWRNRPQVAKMVIFAAAGAIGPLLLQASIWKMVYGSWVLRGYEGEGFAFNLGNQLRVLFSSRHGLLFWHPLVLISVIGLAIGIRRAKNARHGIFLWMVAGSLLFMTLLYGAWSTWSLGWSAGARWAADPFFLWALGLSIFCQYFLRRWPRSILVLLSTLTLISVTLIVCQRIGLVPQDDFLRISIPRYGTIELP